MNAYSDTQQPVVVVDDWEHATTCICPDCQEWWNGWEHAEDTEEYEDWLEDLEWLQKGQW